MEKDIRIDQYVKNAPDFAREIIVHLRNIIWSTLPEVKETIKWNSPHFLYKGEIICSIMAFKKHVAMTFWKGQYLSDPNNILEPVGKTKMKSMKNIRSLDDLPSDGVLSDYLEEASKLIGGVQHKK